jgi:hypothetical protein
VKVKNSIDPLLPAALVLLSAAVFWSALTPVSGFQGGKRSADPKHGESTPSVKRNSRPEQTTSATVAKDISTANVLFAYEFTQPQFVIRHIVIEHDINGRGKITFQRLGEEDSIVEPITLSPAVREKIAGLWQALGFLDSEVNYQSDKQFPHLGTMRLRMEQGARKRTAEFNWTHNDNAASLVNKYRQIADQAVLVFDISVARENQPLNAPKLMELVESMLRRSALSDPQQLVPLLKEITTDEHLPLIARNHAKRLLKQIEKL